MSNTETLQNAHQDDVIIAKRSTLSDLINDTVNTSINEAFKRFEHLINDSYPTEAGSETPLSLKEGAHVLGIALPTMYSKVSKREFSSYRKGKKVYVYKSELLEYLNSGKRKSQVEIINSKKNANS